MRYPILVKSPNKLLVYAKKQGIILGDWYNQVVAPKDIDMKRTDYISKSCPKAEALAAESVNLPTDRHITEKQVNEIIKTLNSYNS